MSKSYDVTREHKQQGCVNPIEERFNTYKGWYEQILAEEQARNLLVMLNGDKDEKGQQ